MARHRGQAKFRLAPILALAGCTSLSVPGALAQSAKAEARASVSVEQPVGASFAIETSKAVGTAIFRPRIAAGDTGSRLQSPAVVPMTYVTRSEPIFGPAVIWSHEALSVGIIAWDPSGLAIASAGRELVLTAALAKLGHGRRTFLILAQFN